jgi:thiamine transport system permease protein
MLTLILYAVFQALLSTIFSVVGGAFLAHARYIIRMPANSTIYVLAPLFATVPTKLCALGIISCGINGMPGIVYAHVFMNLPFAFYSISVLYHQLAKEMVWISHDLGASSWQTYYLIIFPMLKQKIIGLGAIIFVLCFSSISIPMLLGTVPFHHTIDIYIADAYQDKEHIFFWLATMLRLLVVVPVMRWSNQLHHDNYTKIHNGERMPESHSHIIWWRIGVYFLCIMFFVPCSAIIWTMIKERVDIFLFQMLCGYSSDMFNGAVWPIIMRSIGIAIISSIGSVCIAIGLYMLQQCYAVRSQMMTVLIYTPFLLGSVFTGIFFDLSIWLFGGSSLIAIICSHIFLHYSFAYQMLVRCNGYAYQELTMLAASMGATRAQVLQTVTLPLLKESIMRGWCIAFGLSLTSMGACLVTNTSECLTIPSAIRLCRMQGDMQGALGLSLVILLLTSGMAWMTRKEKYSK